MFFLSRLFSSSLSSFFVFYFNSPLFSRFTLSKNTALSLEVPAAALARNKRKAKAKQKKPKKKSCEEREKRK